MFIALDSNGERISIENAIKGNKYFCPICGEPLVIKATESLAVKTHFAHKRGSVCYDDWSHDMSEWHLSWQRCFPEQYREVVIERDGVKHRADICIGNTVIEFQHSNITGEEIEKRNSFYISCGYNVVWVFDAADKIKNWLDVSIDPMQCRADDLCWKRAKQQFSVKMPPQVTIYLHYRTVISSGQYPNKEFDIMLLLTKISPKHFTYCKTIRYIFPLNFLRQYGVTIDENILSVTDIINKTKEYVYKEQQRQRERDIRMKQISRSIIYYRRPRRRRWYWRF